MTIWVVLANDELYVRSAYGPDDPWFRRAQVSGGGRIRAGRQERDVVFAQFSPGVHAAIDAAYHAKDDRYGPKIVGTVVGPQSRGCDYPSSSKDALIPRSHPSLERNSTTLLVKRPSSGPG